MTTSALFMILAIAVGAGTSQSILSDSSTFSPSSEGEEPVHNCFINGTWYNPCPKDSPWLPEPPPETLPPA
jgi:hypothetical protein